MATIPTYTARKLISSPGEPRVNLQDYEGQAMEGLGRQISSSSFALGDKLRARQEERDNFRDENNYRQFQNTLENDLHDRAMNGMPEGGFGFHDKFLSDVYKPKRDEFLSKVSAKNREKFATILADDSGQDFGNWANKAAATERDATYKWAKDQVAVTQDQLATAISLNPEEYDERLKAGMELIDKMPIPTDERTAIKRGWENMAQMSHLNSLLEKDPEMVLKALGANPGNLSPSSQFEILRKAVIGQESGGDPDAISEAGAIGVMQIMPSTAQWIASQIKDPNFPQRPKGGSMAEWQLDVRDYMRNQTTNIRYGEYYLKYLMQKFPGDLEAALIGYHSGPDNAEKWIKAGRDDKVLGPVGRKYYKEVIARLPGGGSKGMDGIAADMPALAEANVLLKKRLTGGAAARGAEAIDRMQPEFQVRIAAMIKGAPPDIAAGLEIYSGARTRERQQRLWDASDKSGKWVAPPGRSRHEHGDAADLGWNGKSLKHAPPDVREWVHKNASRFGLKFPMSHEPWHVEMQETRGGKMFAAGRYGTLPYDKRQAFIRSADTELTRRLTEERKSTAVERVQVTQAMDNELALISSTGVGSTEFDDTSVARVLGEDDYIKWVEKKEEASRLYTAVQGIETMSPADMQDRISDFKPNPMAQDFAAQERVYRAVVDKADDVSRERANNPDRAAMKYPEVNDQLMKVQDQLKTGQPNPGDVVELVRLMLDTQAQFGVEEKARAPLPREWAFQIGQTLSGRIPTPGKNAEGKSNREDVRAAVAVNYAALQQVFGDYTDEVILYALTQYKGMNATTAERVTDMMKSIAVGGDPFKVRTDTADQEQVEGLSWYQKVGAWFTGDGDPTAEPQSIENPEAITTERILRAINALNSVDTPEEEAVLVEQYGQATIDAAKARIKAGD